MHVFSQAKKDSQNKIWYHQHMRRDTEQEQNKDIYKVSRKLREENCISSQSGGLYKAMEKVTRLGIEGRLRVSWSLCGVVMLMVL